MNLSKSLKERARLLAKTCPNESNIALVQALMRTEQCSILEAATALKLAGRVIQFRES